jgi:hypothetical protein
VPVETRRSARLLSIAMREAALELSAKWKKRGVDLGIGIAQGFATVGAIGFEGRIDYGAIGTVTNLAARLCQQAKAGQIILSQRVYAEVGDAIEAEDLGELQLHGFARPAHAYRWLGAPGRSRSGAPDPGRVRTAACASIRQLCCLGVTGEQLMPSLLSRCGNWSAPSAAFFWSRRAGRHDVALCGAPAASAGDAALLRALLRCGRIVVQAWLPNVRGSPTRCSRCRHRRPERSAYYNEVMRHLDAHHVLYGVVRRQKALGQ